MSLCFTSNFIPTYKSMPIWINTRHIHIACLADSVVSTTQSHRGHITGQAQHKGQTSSLWNRDGSLLVPVSNHEPLT